MTCRDCTLGVPRHRCEYTPGAYRHRHDYEEGGYSEWLCPLPGDPLTMALEDEFDEAFRSLRSDVPHGTHG